MTPIFTSMGLNIGCSRESASRIIDLLYRESGGDALLHLNRSLSKFETRAVKPPPPKPPSPERKPSARGGTSKITPEILLYVHDPIRRLWDIEQTRKAIREVFGISMSPCTIYKIWKIPPASKKGQEIINRTKNK